MAKSICLDNPVLTLKTCSVLLRLKVAVRVHCPDHSQHAITLLLPAACHIQLHPQQLGHAGGTFLLDAPSLSMITEPRAQLNNKQGQRSISVLPRAQPDASRANTMVLMCSPKKLTCLPHGDANSLSSVPQLHFCFPSCHELIADTCLELQNKNCFMS